MAKPPVDTYEKMISFIQSQLKSKRFVANYQMVMIKLLLQNGNQTKKQIAEELWKQNNFERNSSFYLGVPVYRVLVNNGVVTKNGDIFSLVLQNISDTQKQEIINELDSSKDRHENFLKTGYLPFKQAREFVRKLGFTTREEWEEYCNSGKKPDNIPSNPWNVYKKRK
jgi:AraC-like DNA-binding protein